MNGATADPCDSTNSKLINSRNSTIGVSHHFFRTLKKSQINPNLEAIVSSIKINFAHFVVFCEICVK